MVNATTFWGRRSDPAGNSLSFWGGATPKMISHADGCNLQFVDGHVKAQTKGSLKWYKNIYLPKIYERRKEDNGSWWPNGPQ